MTEMFVEWIDEIAKGRAITRADAAMAPENEYTDAVVQTFKELSTKDLKAKDYLQLARVLTSHAASEFEQMAEECLEDEQAPKYLVKYMQTNYTLITTAKRMLWEAQLPHEIANKLEEEE